MKTGRFMAGAGVLIFALLMTVSPALAKETPVPEKPSMYVKDEADALIYSQEDELNEMLRKYDQKTGTQIAVLIVRTTGNESIEKYSYRVASSWGIGQKGKDNGILITIATDDHADRIEVGKGLESKVTDSRAGRILRSDEVTSAFRSGNWYEGTKSIVKQTQECISTKENPTDEKEKPALLSSLLMRTLPFIIIMILPLLDRITEIIFSRSGSHSYAASKPSSSEGTVYSSSASNSVVNKTAPYSGESKKNSSSDHLSSGKEEKKKHSSSGYSSYGSDSYSSSSNDSWSDDSSSFGSGGFDDWSSFGGGGFGGGGASGGW